MLVPRRLVLLVASLLLTLCDALTAAAPTGTVDREDTTVNVGRQRSTSCHPVRFDSILPTKLCAKPNEETDPPAVVFSWEGGNGRYSFFKVPKAASEPVFYLRNTGATTVRLALSYVHLYPPGTTFTFGIMAADDLRGQCGDDYQASETTPEIPVVLC